LKCRDDSKEGKGVKKIDFDCMNGDVEWTGPYGGLFVNIKGPVKEHELCIQASSIGTSALVSSVSEDNQLKRLVTILEPKNHQHVQKRTLCFPAYKDTLLFVEPDVGAFISSKITIEYDIEQNPRYGEDGKFFI